ncbi:hypothetical protein GALMADRAFT_256644 [Galerina marginata CBS 339.88]|uniref:Uncharacterized protein n=1 Tax=Galerina marginata (strain CBS 339.88) TaxID=685588 RepID=A0A067SFK5_GALM3|nr:hypothetical protein GALMADRAFT_256644 [Galerina marginata CBS 339.88]
MTSYDDHDRIWNTHLPPLQVSDSRSDSEEELVRCIDILARVVEVLDIPDASFASYSTAIDKLTVEKLTLSRSLNRLKQVEDELNHHLASLKHERDLLAHWNEVLSPGSSSSLNPETAATIERRREALVKKAKECHRELETMLAEEPLEISVTVSQLLAQKEKNQAKEREIKEKRTKLKAFQGLPPNLEMARHELRVARQRQTELIQLRERLLGKMADGVA